MANTLGFWGGLFVGDANCGRRNLSEEADADFFTKQWKVVEVLVLVIDFDAEAIGVFDNVGDD